MNRDYISAEKFDYMNDVELDVLDFDYNYQPTNLTKEDCINRLADHSYYSKTAMNGMSYEFIQLLNDKMSDLEWKKN